MAIVRTEAFVLKAVRFGETSMIYRLFTRDRGVVPVIAKGARRPKSRFGAALGTFQRLLVTYYQKEGREVQTLSGVDLLAAHRGIAASLPRLEAAGRISTSGSSTFTQRRRYASVRRVAWRDGPVGRAFSRSI